jgi:hypothetical protein
MDGYDVGKVEETSSVKLIISWEGYLWHFSSVWS